MAGIGFELQKLLKKGDITSFVKVAFAGIVIVAGPWLLSILGIFVISRISGRILGQDQSIFMSVIIYTYAFSLFIFGGSHYIFTRYLADLEYLREHGKVGSALFFFSCLILIAASAVSLPGIRLLYPGEIDHPTLFRFSCWLFFVTVNWLWVLMIFISLLRKYLAIFATYLFGMTMSTILAFLLTPLYGVSGTVAGFAAGQLFCALVLLSMSLKEYKPSQFRATVKDFIKYFPKYGFLFLSGLFYYWGIWIDKILFWQMFGVPIAETRVRLFELYDIPVYLANLAMIPALVYFVVICETDYYLLLKDFLHSLGGEIYRKIKQKKERLLSGTRSALKEQVVFLGVFIFVLVLLAPVINSLIPLNSLVLRITLTAVFFHFLYLTLMTFLFYLELYRFTFLSSLIFFLVNLISSFVIGLTGNQDLCGLSYLLGGIAASFTSFILLIISLKKIDNNIFAKYST